MRTESTRTDFEFAPPEQPGNALEGFAFAWRRKTLVLVTFVVGLGFGFLYFLQQKPTYRSGAQILIVEQRARFPIEGLNVSSNYRATHDVLIRSPIVIHKAVTKHGLDQLPTLRNSRDPVATVIAGLTATGNPSSTGDILKLSFASRHRDDSRKILAAVVDAYQEFLGDLYQNVSQETNDLITRGKDQLDRELTIAEQEYRKFRYSAPLLFMGNTTQNIHETRLMHIEMARSKAILDNSKLQAKIDSLTDAQQRGADREVLNLMVGNIQQAHSNLSEGARLSIDQQIFPLMLEERDLLEEYGPDHPLVLAVQKRIALARSHFLGSKKQGGQLGSRPRDFFEVYLESLRVEVAMNIRTIQHMNQLFENERAASKLLAFDQVTDQAFRSKIARKSRLFDVVLKRLEEINLIKDAGGAVVQVIHPPDSGIQHMTSLYSVLLTSGLLALVFGLGLAFAVDATDHRYRSPDEIRDDLSLPVIGHIPRFSKSRTKSKSLNAPATSLLAPELQTIIEPRGVTAEAIRAVRTAVYFSANGSGAKVIQVTSPFPLDGKSTVAANLAVSIANTGKFVLLIDADFRNPCCHKLFNLDNRAGMTGAIEGQVQLDDAICQTGIDNLNIMTSGLSSENPSELLTSSRFEELLVRLRSQYEMIILDTPPVLMVTDPLNVAARVDAVLLVVRLSKNARSGSCRALNALEEVGASVLGIVVNAVGARDRSRGYRYDENGYRSDRRRPIEHTHNRSTDEYAAVAPQTSSAVATKTRTRQQHDKFSVNSLDEAVAYLRDRIPEGDGSP